MWYNVSYKQFNHHIFFMRYFSPFLIVSDVPCSPFNRIRGSYTFPVFLRKHGLQCHVGILFATLLTSLRVIWCYRPYTRNTVSRRFPFHTHSNALRTSDSTSLLWCRTNKCISCIQMGPGRHTFCDKTHNPYVVIRSVFKYGSTSSVNWLPLSIIRSFIHFLIR